MTNLKYSKVTRRNTSPVNIIYKIKIFSYYTIILQYIYIYIYIYIYCNIIIINKL